MLKKTRLFDKFIDIEFTKEIMLPLNSGLAPTPLNCHISVLVQE